MRDYNAIQFRSPSDKQKQTVTSSYSPGLISTVRSTSLSPIPRVGPSTKASNTTITSGAMASTTTTDDRTQSGYSGVTSTTVASSSVHSNADMDNIRLPYLPTEHKPLQQQQQQSSSSASTNILPNTSSTSKTSIQPRINQVASLSPPQRSSNKSYRSASPVENAMSLSPTPYNTTTGTGSSSSHNQNGNNNNAIHPQQQHANSAPTTNTSNYSNAVNGSNASVTSTSSALVLSPTDALALRRDYNNNFELYIQKLRTDIEQQQMTIHKISSASSKSDAVILELRSTIRQYKRQLDKLQQQQPSDKIAVAGISDGAGHATDTSFLSGMGTIDTNPSTLQQQPQVPLSDSDIQNHPVVVELTEQLQDLQNKLMTADLIRKELEDTIEAEQYTWELRVQDLEREVHELKQQAVVSGGSHKTTVEPVTASRSAAVTNEMSEDYRKQLEDAQNEIQRYRSIIMTTTTTSDIDDDHVQNNSSMNTDASSTNNNSNNILIGKKRCCC